MTAQEQRQADKLEHIREYIAKNCHRYSRAEIADHLGVSTRMVDLFYPRASR